MSEEVVRRLSLTFSETGADATTGKVNRLAEASGNLATVTDTNAKRALSAQAAFDKLTNQIDETAKAQAAIEKGTRTLNDALAQGVISQDKYNESLALLHEKYDGVDEAGDNVSEGFRSTGIEAASVANHIKNAAAAAYALSPAFRALVNPLVGAGLSATGAALAAMSPAAAALALNLAQRVAPLLGQIAAFALPFALIRAEIALIAFAWSSAGEQIEKYNNLSKEANNAGVSTDFWQRHIKGATDAGLKIDEATTSLKKFKDISQEKLGGSDLDQKLEAHLKVGNVSENGLLSVKNATTVEEKYRALTVLLTDMAESGKRLAALDIAATFLSPAALENFRQGNDYLSRIQENADKIAATKLVNPQDIADAIQLQNRYDEAVKILSERWIPFQESITAGGMVMQRTWVGIVELLATAVTGITNFAAKIGELIGSVPQLGRALKFGLENTLNMLTAGMYGLGKAGVNYLSGPGATPADDARSRLASGLSNPSAVSAAKSFTNGISNSFRKDTSKSLNVQETEDYADAVDRAINSIQKHILAQEADAKAVGLGAGALAEFRVQAAETAAVLANGGHQTEEQKRRFAELAVEARAAAEALAAAQIASDINRGRQLAFASPEDVRIANQLRGLYGDDIPRALASSEAAALRMNQAMKSIADSIRDMASSFVRDFLGGLKEGKSLGDSLASSMKNLSNSLLNSGVNDLFSGNFISAGLKIGGSFLTSLFGGDDEEEQKKQQQQAEERQRQIAAGNERKAAYTLQAQLAGIDTGTIAGQIQAFDLQANKQRADEMKEGGYAIVELEKKLAIERQQIVDKANAQVIKSYQEFLDSVKTGDLSTLSPEDQLKYAQAQFNSNVEKAKTGDPDAIAKVIADAQNLLQIAKSFYASSAAYSSIYESVTSTVTALKNSTLYTAKPDPGIINQTSSPVGDDERAIMAGYTGYADGGLVRNGKFGVDSVFARLAGGEHVTRAGSVNAATRTALDFINRTGKPPIESPEVARILTQGFNGQTTAIVNAIMGLSERMKSLEDTTRQVSNQRRVPGSTKKAA